LREKTNTFDYNITFINTSISLTEDAHIIAYTKNKLSLELITSPPRKKSRTIFRSPVNDSKEDEEQTSR
jgi:hypothetical protein